MFSILGEVNLYVTPPCLPIMDGIGTCSYLLSAHKEVSSNASSMLALREHVPRILQVNIELFNGKLNLRKLA